MRYYVDTTGWTPLICIGSAKSCKNAILRRYNWLDSLDMHWVCKILFYCTNAILHGHNCKTCMNGMDTTAKQNGWTPLICIGYANFIIVQMRYYMDTTATPLICIGFAISFYCTNAILHGYNCNESLMVGLTRLWTTCVIGQVSSMQLKPSCNNWYEGCAESTLVIQWPINCRMLTIQIRSTGMCTILYSIA